MNLLPGRMRHQALGSGLVLALACVAGFVLRTANAATVLLGGAVVFAENDPYYHMRRVFQVLADYPSVPSFDSWIDHPNGAPIVFAPLFDLGIATLALLCGLTPNDRLAVETLAAFVPPLLGALTCLPVYALARRTTSPAAALLAAILIAATPAHIWYSRLGFVDHHVAVTLLAVVMSALALRALRIGPGRASVAAASEGRLRAASAAAVATSMAGGVLLWNGFLLLVAVLDVALLALFVRGDAVRRPDVAGLVCVTHLLAALVVLAVVPGVVRDTGWPWSAITLSFLHPSVLAGTGLIAGAGAWLVHRGARGRTLARLAALLAAVVLLVLSVQQDAIARLHDWLLASDPFMGAVQESVSILRTSDGRIDLGEVQIWMGRLFLAVPLLLALLAYRLARGGFADEGRLFVLVWAGLLFGLTIVQRRFGETAAPALAILLADFLVRLGASLRSRLAKRGLSRRTARTVAWSAVALLVVLNLAPYHGGFFDQPDRLTVLRRAPLLPNGSAAYTALDRAQQHGSVDVRLYRTLRRLAELNADRDPGTASNGGAMAAWPLGHKLLYLARTPVVVTPFGSYVGGAGFADSTDYFLTDDDAHARLLLERRRIRWVVADNDLGTIGAAIVGRGENPRAYYDKQPLSDGGFAYLFRAPLIRSIYFRLTRLAGSYAQVATPQIPRETVPAVPGLRLVIDSASDDMIGFAKVYEVVPGARVVVRTVPGADVRARYEYRSGAGRSRVQEQVAVADDRGEALLVLAYSSERPDLGHTSAWRIESAGREREIRVREHEVRAGGTLAIDFE